MKFKRKIIGLIHNDHLEAMQYLLDEEEVLQGEVSECDGALSRDYLLIDRLLSMRSTVEERLVRSLKFEKHYLHPLLQQAQQQDLCNGRRQEFTALLSDVERLDGCIGALLNRDDGDLYWREFDIALKQLVRTLMSELSFMEGVACSLWSAAISDSDDDRLAALYRNAHDPADGLYTLMQENIHSGEGQAQVA